MVGLVRWLKFNRFGAARPADDDGMPLFDRVDADALELGEFRASGSMHFSDATINDFSDTLPAYSREGSLLQPGWVRHC